MELSIPSGFLNTPSSNAAATALLKNKPRILLRFPSIPLLPSQRSLSPFTLKQMNNNSQSPLSCSSLSQNKGSPPPTSPSTDPGRIGEVERMTKETNVWVMINLDGTGVANSSTSIPFLDHMLDQLASHGLFDVHVKATGDIHIDDHHTNEDVALALGTALLQALGDRKGINRFGDFSAPLDEALIHVSLDLSGRPHLSYDLNIPTARVGTYDTQLVEHFFQSLVNTSGMTLHIRQHAGKNSHHIIEATFKAFARALRQATEYDPRRLGTIPRSSKDFPDMHGLIMHTYYSDNADLHVDHSGLHKARCVLMGWNYSKPPDNSKAYQFLPADEAATNQEDLITWPPGAHNTIVEKGKHGRFGKQSNG